jgi:hypothetical protein
MTLEEAKSMPPEESLPVENQPDTSPAIAPQEKSSHFLLAQPDTGELSRKGKRNALVFLALGLLTFFLPVINFDPPLHDQQHWSVLQVVWHIPAPATDTPATTFPATLTIAFEWVYAFYGTLVAGVGVVLLFPYRKLLLGVCLASLACLFFPFHGALGILWLAAMTSIQSDRGGDLKTLWILFGIEVAALAVVTWTDTTT